MCTYVPTIYNCNIYGNSVILSILQIFVHVSVVIVRRQVAK